MQVKVIFTGRLINYEEICSLYYDCERMLRVHDPAKLLLHLYLQVLLCFCPEVEQLPYELYPVIAQTYPC